MPLHFARRDSTVSSPVARCSQARPRCPPCVLSSVRLRILQTLPKDSCRCLLLRCSRSASRSSWLSLPRTTPKQARRGAVTWMQALLRMTMHPVLRISACFIVRDRCFAMPSHVWVAILLPVSRAMRSTPRDGLSAWRSAALKGVPSPPTCSRLSTPCRMRKTPLAMRRDRSRVRSMHFWRARRPPVP